MIRRDLCAQPDVVLAFERSLLWLLSVGTILTLSRAGTYVPRALPPVTHRLHAFERSRLCRFKIIQIIL